MHFCQLAFKSAIRNLSEISEQNRDLSDIYDTILLLIIIHTSVGSILPDIPLLSGFKIVKFVATKPKYAQFFTREQLSCIKSDQEDAFSQRVSSCGPQEAFEGNSFCSVCACIYILLWYTAFYVVLFL